MNVKLDCLSELFSLSIRLSSLTQSVFLLDKSVCLSVLKVINLLRKSQTMNQSLSISLVYICFILSLTFQYEILLLFNVLKWKLPSQCSSNFVYQLLHTTNFVHIVWNKGQNSCSLCFINDIFKVKIYIYIFAFMYVKGVENSVFRR